MHKERTCTTEDALSFQFTKFPSEGKMLKSRKFEVTMETVKEIVGTTDLKWEVWQKDANKKYQKIEG